MVTVKIYLSTLARLTVNANDYDESYSGVLFSKLVEKDSYSIPLGFSYGGKHKTNAFTCKFSGAPSYLKAIEGYNAIKVAKVVNTVETTVFLGCNPTFKRTIETADYWSETASFDDYTKTLEDKPFNSDESWSWNITTTNAYKVCDPSDTSHSLLHTLFGYINNPSRYTLHCTYSDTTVVPFFTVTGEQKILDVWQNFIKQQGLAYYFENFDVYIIDILEDSTTTATTIPNIETKATVTDKPYIEKKIPSIRRPTILTYTNERVFFSGTISVRSSVSGDNWYPSSDVGTYAMPSYEYLRDNQSVSRYYNLKYDFEAEGDINPDIYIWDGTTKTKVGDGSKSGTVSGSKLKYSVCNENWTLARWFRLSLYASIDILDYNQLVEPDDADSRSGDEEKAEYLYSDSACQRYMKALLYAKDMEAKSYSFYSDLDLSLNDICVINNVTQSGEYIRITDKQDTLDDFGGYTYTATVYQGDNVTVSSSYSYDLSTPYIDKDFDFTASRTFIACDSENVAYDNTAIRFTVTPKKYFARPTLTYGSTTVQMTRATQSSGSETVNLDSWYYDVPVSAVTGQSLTVKATLVDCEKELIINRVDQSPVAGADIIVPAGYTLVTQYCYGTSLDPEERWVADASYTLEDASFIVSDIHWTDENSDGTCPLSHRSGYYIWRRQGVYISPATSPSSWSVSRYSNPSARFNFKLSSETYERNDRSSDSNLIYVYPDIIDYDCTTLVVKYGSTSLTFDATNQRYTLTLAKKNAPSSITIEATLGSLVWSKTLTVVDVTSEPIYLGVVSSASEFPPSTIEGSLISGDYFVVGSSDFTVSSKTYKKGTTYSYNGSSWDEMTATANHVDYFLKCLDGLKKANVDLSLINDPNTTSWFKTIVSDTLIVNELLSNNITSANYSEASDGTPETGYKLSYNGGSGGAGEIKSVGGIYKDMNVRGTLDLTKSDGTTGADIKHPCLETVPTVAGDSTGVTIANSPVAWNPSDVSSIGTQDADYYYVDNGTYGSTSIDKAVKVTSQGQTLYDAHSESSVQIGRSGTYSLGTVSKKCTVTVSGTRPKNYKSTFTTSHHYALGVTVKDSTGTVYATIAEEDGGATYPATAFSLTFVVDGEDTAKTLQIVTTDGAGENTTNGSATLSTSIVYASDYGFDTAGIYVKIGTSWTAITSPTTSRLYFDTMSGDSFDSDDYKTYNVVTNFAQYTGFGSTTLETDIPYKITSTGLYYNGSAVTGKYFTRSSSIVATLTLSDGTTITLSTSGTNLYKKLYGTIAIAETSQGVEMTNLYPKGTSAIGTSAKRWSEGYINVLHPVMTASGQSASGSAVVVSSYYATDGSEWYRRWSDGWIEQGGCITTAGTNADQTYNLATPFTTTNYTILKTSHWYYTGSATPNFFNIFSKTTTTFTTAHSSITTGGGGFSWYACGY